MLEEQDRLYAVIIPGFIANRDDLTRTDKYIFGVINGLAFNRGYCFATNKYLALKCDCDERTIQRTVSKIEKMGFWLVELNGYSLRRITTFKLPDKLDSSNDPDMQEEMSPMTSMSSPSDTNVTPNIKENNITSIKKEENSISPISNSFSNFYKLKELVKKRKEFKRLHPNYKLPKELLQEQEELEEEKSVINTQEELTEEDKWYIAKYGFTLKWADKAFKVAESVRNTNYRKRGN